MADAYLNVAEHVLSVSRIPLHPRDIIDRAYEQQLLPWHLHGTRQDKTLHARLAEDIASHSTQSRFFRTAPGIFFLRKFIDDHTLPGTYKAEYDAKPRRKEFRSDRILALEGSDFRALVASGKFVDVPVIYGALNRGRYRFLTYQELCTEDASIAVHSFALVFSKGKILSYTCGKFTPESAPLYRARSIGIGGPVYASDQDMLFPDMSGVIASGINELGYGIGLTRRLSERARYRGEMLPCVGVFVSKTESRPTILHVVLAYECPEEFVPTKAALSINDLHWIDIRGPVKALHEFDETSRLLIESGRIDGIRSMLTIEE